MLARGAGALVAVGFWLLRDAAAVFRELASRVEGFLAFSLSARALIRRRP